MIAFANAKINIGLQVFNRRADGYHNLETVFYPIKLYDVIEVVEGADLRFIPSGTPVPGSGENNLCLKAYRLLNETYALPPVHIYLHKHIPIGAGLGGGSADAAFLLTLLNNHFGLGLSESELIGFARQLGADCPFFIKNRPVMATGIGDLLEDIDVNLSGYWMVLVAPPVHVSTAEAYGTVVPHEAGRQLRTAIRQPVDTWQDAIVNDFEAGIFAVHPEIAIVKRSLYEAGAVYASMSGSGSSVYGLFRKPVKLPDLELDNQVFYLEI